MHTDYLLAQSVVSATFIHNDNGTYLRVHQLVDQKNQTQVMAHISYNVEEVGIWQVFHYS
jgi:hypothetical protein